MYIKSKTYNTLKVNGTVPLNGICIMIMIM